MRGKAGRMLEMKRSEGSNQDWRAVIWEEPVSDGVLEWVVSTSSVHFSREQTLGLADSLVEY